MSLKAKIEAVIYASEEPVTLVQLAGLLGQEAQAEIDHLDSAQHRLTLDDPSEAWEVSADPDMLNDEVLSPVDEPEGSVAAIAQRAADEALHEAEARDRHASMEAQHHAADNAAMSSADAPEGNAPVLDAPEEHGSGVERDADKLEERTAARAEKARTQRLREYFRALLEQLTAEYATSDRGLEIREVAGGYRLATKPEYHDAVRGFVRSLKPPLKLTLQALETLAVVAYKQPVTAPEISEIRGVDTGGVLGSLLARKLITTAGRKQVIGRPILYKTTRDFLLRFGLKDISELPSIEEFEKMAGELRDAESIQKEISMPDDPKNEEKTVTDANNEEMKEATEPQADGDSTDAETVSVDGRISGLPPVYDTAGIDMYAEADSPALDAEIQQEEQQDDLDGKEPTR